ncbi:MAG: flagellar protein [Lachnospiraceae bacterium]|nr:flagellar protein [Lachnospiraceae bacterium]
MNVRNCRKCGKIFSYISGPAICTDCREALEAKFKEVKEYIRENKGVGIPQVAEACDVESSLIKEWLREGRLEVSFDGVSALTCEKCGTPITSGRFCDKCKQSLANDFGNALNASRAQAKPAETQDAAKKNNPKMRFLN